ncbi:MAG: TonB-dependent receptor [Chloracidobacterium sp.]|nr:TonB-dependent receptor [Chloracidobacterium sp.]
MRIRFNLSLVATFMLSLTITVLAQNFNNGTVMGTVTDPSGAAVPDAEVRLIRANPRLLRETRTDAAGNYQIQQVPPGAYQIEFEKTGFLKVQIDAVNLNAAQQLRVDGQLLVGSVTETVKVEASAAQVDTASANIGSTVYGKQVQELALNTRSFTQLMTLQPGVSSQQAQQPGFGSNTSVPFSFNGAQTGSNNWMLDGGRNIDPYNGNNLSMVNLDAIAEVRIERNAYSSEYGRNGGAQLNVITKSGTNDFHGAIFEFFRNDKLDARNFFSPQRPKNRYNNFGGTLGGPIKKDKLFFFISNEYRRIWQSAGTRTGIVPTDAQINGDFSGTRVIRDPLTGQPFPGNIIPSDRIDKNAQALLRAYYARPNFQQGALNFSSSEPDGTYYVSGLGRLDWKVKDSLTLFARYNIDSTRLISPYGLFASNLMPYVADSEQSHIIRGASVSATWVINPNMVNQITGALYGQSLAISTSPNASRSRDPNFQTPHVFDSGTTSAGFIPSISLSQGYAGIQIIWPQNISGYSLELIDNFSWTRGRHTIKFGGSIDKEDKAQNNSNPNNNGTFTFNGQVTGDALADMLLGGAFQYTENSTHVFGAARWKNWALYVQDQWRATNRLTLDFGIRYEIFEPEKAADGLLSLFDPARFDPAQAATINPANGQIVGAPNYSNGIVVIDTPGAPYGNAVINSVYNTIAPRGGFSLALDKANNMVIRGGFGVFHDRWPQLVSAARNNYPFNQSASIFSTSLSNPGQGEQRFFPIGISNNASPWNIPYYMKWSLGIQRALPGEILLDTNYVGSRGVALVRSRDINQPFASADVAGGRLNVNAARPYPGFAAISTNETSGQSSYHSLQVSASRRFVRGLTLQGSYTFSRSIDDVTTPLNSYADNRMERALSSFDRTHVLVLSYVYEFPQFHRGNGFLKEALSGWQLSGISSFESGTPFSITIPGDVAGVGTGGQRPNTTGPIEMEKTQQQWFSGSFALPPPGTFGDLGRDVVRGPGINNWDVSFSKRLAIREKISLQFRAEFFNFFNHTQWSGVSASMGSPNFGHVTSARDPRITQLGLRLIF